MCAFHGVAMLLFPLLAAVCTPLFLPGCLSHNVTSLPDACRNNTNINTNPIIDSHGISCSRGLSHDAAQVAFARKLIDSSTEMIKVYATLRWNGVVNVTYAPGLCPGDGYTSADTPNGMNLAFVYSKTESFSRAYLVIRAPLHYYSLSFLSHNVKVRAEHQQTLNLSVNTNEDSQRCWKACDLDQRKAIIHRTVNQSLTKLLKQGDRSATYLKGIIWVRSSQTTDIVYPFPYNSVYKYEQCDTTFLPLSSLPPAYYNRTDNTDTSTFTSCYEWLSIREYPYIVPKEAFYTTAAVAYLIVFYTGIYLIFFSENTEALSIGKLRRYLFLEGMFNDHPHTADSELDRSPPAISGYPKQTSPSRHQPPSYLTPSQSAPSSNHPRAMHVASRQRSHSDRTAETSLTLEATAANSWDEDVTSLNDEDSASHQQSQSRSTGPCDSPPTTAPPTDQSQPLLPTTAPPTDQSQPLPPTTAPPTDQSQPLLPTTAPPTDQSQPLLPTTDSSRSFSVGKVNKDRDGRIVKDGRYPEQLLASSLVLYGILGKRGLLERPFNRALSGHLWFVYFWWQVIVFSVTFGVGGGILFINVIALQKVFEQQFDTIAKTFSYPPINCTQYDNQYTFMYISSAIFAIIYFPFIVATRIKGKRDCCSTRSHQTCIKVLKLLSLLICSVFLMSLVANTLIIFCYVLTAWIIFHYPILAPVATIVKVLLFDVIKLLKFNESLMPKVAMCKKSVDFAGRYLEDKYLAESAKPGTETVAPRVDPFLTKAFLKLCVSSDVISDVNGNNKRTDDYTELHKRLVEKIGHCLVRRLIRTSFVFIVVAFVLSGLQILLVYMGDISPLFADQNKLSSLILPTFLVAWGFVKWLLFRKHSAKDEELDNQIEARRILIKLLKESPGSVDGSIPIDSSPNFRDSYKSFCHVWTSAIFNPYYSPMHVVVSIFSYRFPPCCPRKDAEEGSAASEAR